MKEYKISLFDTNNKSIRDIPITENEYYFLITKWENPLKEAIALSNCEKE